MSRAPRVRLADLPPDQRKRVQAAKRKAKKQEQARIRRHFRTKGLPGAETEFEFHPDRKWRFDVAWPEHRVALEVEGGVWTGGRHTRGAGFLADVEKYNAAAVLGWRLLRTVPSDLFFDATADLIRAAIDFEP